MASKLTKTIEYAVAIALAGVLIWVALRGVDWKVFMDSLSQTRWVYVILCALCALASNIFREERWRDMMITIDPQTKRRRLWDSLNIGNVVSIAVPWAGTLVRAGAIKGTKSSYDKTFGTILMERTWDMLMVFIILVAAILANSGDIARFFVDKIAAPVAGRMNLYVWLALGALLILAGVAIWCIFHFKERIPFFQKLAGWLDGMAVGFKSFKDVRWKPRFVFYSVMVWLPYVYMCFFIFKAIPCLDQMNFADALFISAVGSLAALVPVPGGFGAYHYLTALAISSIYGASWETGILFATLNHEARIVLLLVLGAASAISTQIGNKKG